MKRIIDYIKQHETVKFSLVFFLAICLGFIISLFFGRPVNRLLVSAFSSIYLFYLAVKNLKAGRTRGLNGVIVFRKKQPQLFMFNIVVLFIFVGVFVCWFFIFLNDIFYIW